LNYAMTTPCDECPFLNSMAHGFTLAKLFAFASGEFGCHKACDIDDDTGNFVERGDATPHCAGALIFLEKIGRPHQMMRICGRLGLYDFSKLNMGADVRDPLGEEEEA